MQASTRSRKGLAALVIALMCVMCLAIAGCSGSGGNSKYDANFGGVWKLVSYTDDGVDQNVAELERYGYVCELTLAEDKTAALNLFTEFMTGTWESQSESTVQVKLSGMTMAAQVEAGRLTISDKNDKLTFEKSAKAPATAPSSGPARGTSSTGGSSTGTSSGGSSGGPAAVPPATPRTVESGSVGSVIADDDVATITVLSKGLDPYDWAGYELRMKNNTNKPIVIMSDDDFTSVNGLMAEPLLVNDIDPGKSVDDWVTWDPEDLISSPDQLVNVHILIYACDADTFETLQEWEVTLDEDGSVAAVAMPSNATVIVDDSQFTIAYVTKDTVFGNWPAYQLWVTNKTDRNIYVEEVTNSFKVNGTADDPYCSQAIMAGTSAQFWIPWDSDSGPIKSLDKLTNVTGKLSMLDYDSWEPTATYDIKLP